MAGARVLVRASALVRLANNKADSNVRETSTASGGAISLLIEAVINHLWTFNNSTVKAISANTRTRCSGPVDNKRGCSFESRLYKSARNTARDSVTR